MNKEYNKPIEIPDWMYPEGELTLSPGMVHLWRLQLDHFSSREVYPELETSLVARSYKPNDWYFSTFNALSRDEVDRLTRFRYTKDKRKYALRRGWLRLILAQYLSLEPSQIKFVYNDNGKPLLDDSQNSIGIQFNMTGSFDIVLYAVGLNNRLGIDIEMNRLIEGAERIAESFFSSEELSTLKKLPAEDQKKAFLNCWTRKEALLKALGFGISQSLDQYEVSLSPLEPPEVRSIVGDLEKAKSWSVVSFSPDVDYLAALVVEGNISEIKYWDCRLDWIK